jgi:hypothetical protein
VRRLRTLGVAHRGGGVPCVCTRRVEGSDPVALRKKSPLPTVAPARAEVERPTRAGGPLALSLSTGKVDNDTGEVGSQQEVAIVVMTTQGNVDPSPDPNAPGIKQGAKGKPKTVRTSRGGSLPGNPTRRQGSLRRGGRGGR